MTEFVSRDNLKSILARKMAAFNNALNRIQRAETESIFASMSQKTAEYRMQQFMAMAEKWEGIKGESRHIDQMYADVMVSFALIQCNSLMAKVNRLKQMTTQYETEVKDEAFKLLDIGIDMMKDNLKTIDEQIANCQDPKELASLQQQRSHSVKALQKAEEIKKIKDPEEAMRALYSFSQDSYREFLKKTSNLTDEEIDTKLASIQPETNDVFGYFQAAQGVWGLFKKDMQSLNTQLEQNKTSLASVKEEYAALEEQKQALLAKKESIDTKKDGIQETDNMFNLGKVAMTAVTPALGPLAATGLEMIEQYVTSDERKELSEAEQQYQEEMAALQTQALSLEKQSQTLLKTGQLENVAADQPENSENVQQQLEQIEAQQSSLEATINNIEGQQSQLGSITKRISNIQGSDAYQQLNKQSEEVQENVRQIQAHYRAVSQTLEKMEQLQKQAIKTSDKVVENSIEDSYKGTLEKIMNSRKSATKTISSETLNANDLTSQINIVKKQLNESEVFTESNKKSLLKEVKTIKEQVEKADLITKLSQFIKTNTTNDTKIVIDKSLGDLYSGLSLNIGTDRVVVDKRNGDRRSGQDRRLEAQKENDLKKDPNNFFERKDVAGRRSGDRRHSNHIFISQEMLNNLNLQS